MHGDLPLNCYISAPTSWTTLFGVFLTDCDDDHSMQPSYGGLLLPARVQGATRTRPVGESETQATFLPFALLTQALKYLDPEVVNVRLLAKAYRQTVDGYFVAERRRLLFHLPLGYNARKRLSAWDYYVVSVYGGVPRGNDVRRYSDEYNRLAPEIQDLIKRRAQAYSLRHETELSAHLPPLPADLQTCKLLQAHDVYAIRKHGVEAWRRQANMYFLEDEEYMLLSQACKDRLWDEARAYNERNSVTTFKAPPLPSDFTTDEYLEAADVMAIRLHGLEAWRRCRLHSRFTIDFLRLSRQIKDVLWSEARAINRRNEITQLQEVESFPPANFHPRAFITGFDVFHIKCEGLASWQSGVRPESLLFSRYMLLSRDLRSQLQAAADDFNCSNVLTQADLVKMQAISPEGHVRPRGGGEGGPNGQHTARKRQRRALQHGQDTGCACAM